MAKKSAVAETAASEEETLSFGEINRAYLNSGGDLVLWDLVDRAASIRSGRFLVSLLTPEEKELLEKWSKSK